MFVDRVNIFQAFLNMMEVKNECRGFKRRGLERRGLNVAELERRMFEHRRSERRINPNVAVLNVASTRTSLV